MGRGRILVVDDEIQIRALDRALVARGYTMSTGHGPWTPAGRP